MISEPLTIVVGGVEFEAKDMTMFDVQRATFFEQRVFLPAQAAFADDSVDDARAEAYMAAWLKWVKCFLKPNDRIDSLLAVNVLTPEEAGRLRSFFSRWAQAAERNLNAGSATSEDSSRTAQVKNSQSGTETNTLST